MRRMIRLDDSLDRAMRQTFEGMTFTQVVRRPAGDEPPTDRASAIWARIEVGLPPIGELIVVVEPAVAKRLELAVLGSAASDGTDRYELLGELLNALAGCWARILAPEARDLRVGMPQLGRGDWGDEAGADVAVYQTDEQEIVRVVRRRVLA